MKKISYSKKILMLVAILMTISSLITIVGAYDSEVTVIVAPDSLEGLPGTEINVSDIFVQKITFYEVKNITDIEVVDDYGNVITLFPREEYKATVRSKDTKDSLGFILLTPVDLGNKLTVSSEYSGEFLFYQNGRIFNKLGLAEEGKIYFYQTGKTETDAPIILNIGNISNGEFTYKDYVIVDVNTIKLRRNWYVWK